VFVMRYSYTTLKKNILYNSLMYSTPTVLTWSQRYLSRHSDDLLFGLLTLDSRQRKSCPSELHRVQVTSGVHPASEVGSGGFPKGVMLPGHKADNSFPSNAEIKNGNAVYTLPYTSCNSA
jgi:hypothetical protein